jgi:16S rRNA processing protein RimM
MGRDGELHEVKPQNLREQGKGVVLKLPGCETREDAERHLGEEIWIPRAALPAPRPGEYYWVDLEGLEVLTVDGQSLGRISHMLATGANDVMVVAGERERLIPFTQGLAVQSVDLDAQRVVVDWDPEF